jgi:drug/metabolite transporter (DMT)-like permease
MPSKHALLIASCLGAIYLVWGTTYYALRIVVEHMPVYLAAAARFTFAGVILLGVSFARGERAPVPLGRALASALLNFTIGNGLVGLAELSVPSSVAALLGALTPMFASMLSQFGGTAVSGREWVGMLLGLAGVAWLSAFDGRISAFGTAMVLASAFSWACGSILQKRWQLTSGNAPGVQILLGGVTMALVGLVRGEHWNMHAPREAYGALLYLAVFGSLVAFSCYTLLLKHSKPTLALSYAYVTPLVALAVGNLLGGEPLTPRLLGAAALILPGIALIATRAGFRSAPPAPEDSPTR